MKKTILFLSFFMTVGLWANINSNINLTQEEKEAIEFIKAAKEESKSIKDKKYEQKKQKENLNEQKKKKEKQRVVEFLENDKYYIALLLKEVNKSSFQILLDAKKWSIGSGNEYRVNEKELNLKIQNLQAEFDRSKRLKILYAQIVRVLNKKNELNVGLMKEIGQSIKKKVTSLEKEKKKTQKDYVHSKGDGKDTYVTILLGKQVAPGIFVKKSEGYLKLYTKGVKL